MVLVQLLAVPKCCVIEQHVLSVLLQIIQLNNEYQVEAPSPGVVALGLLTFFDRTMHSIVPWYPHDCSIDKLNSFFVYHGILVGYKYVDTLQIITCVY